MTDEELVCAFESTELPASAFPHAAHVRVAWYYLRRDPFPVAVGRFVTGLRTFAAAKGVPGLYHETVTTAWLVLINERLDGARELTWEAFAAAHPELFTRPSLLSQYYTDETLRSDRARRVFVMPDRLPAAALA